MKTFKKLTTIVCGVLVLGWFTGCVGDLELQTRTDSHYRHYYYDEPREYYTYENYPVVKYHIYNDQYRSPRNKKTHHRNYYNHH